MSRKGWMYCVQEQGHYYIAKVLRKMAVWKSQYNNVPPTMNKKKKKKKDLYLSGNLQSANRLLHL